jgi:hypothetical protein
MAGNYGDNEQPALLTEVLRGNREASSYLAKLGIIENLREITDFPEERLKF